MKVDKDSLKENVNISDAIEKIYSISRRANGAFCKCPFHSDNSPSLSIVDAKGFYYCFGCGESGDMYDFYMKYLKITFKEAFERISDEFGYSRDNTSKVHSVYLEINKLASKLYHKNTNEYLEKEFNDFLNDRKLTKENANTFGIGITGRGNQLAKYISTFEEDKRLLWQQSGLELGLLYKSGNDYFDSFKNRVIFPIYNKSSDILGFASRVYLEFDNGPKYKNSPSSIVFNKADILYGENLLDSRANSIVLVEGYMDVISLQSKGIKNVVGLMGLSLGERKISELLEKYSEVFIGLDNDTAGVEATKKISTKFLTQLYLPRSLDWSPFKDGDEFIRNSNKEAFDRLLVNSKPMIKIRGLDDI